MLRSRLENRWNSLKYLDNNSKIDLITMLTQSLKSTGKRKKISARYSGMYWESTASVPKPTSSSRAEVPSLQ